MGMRDALERVQGLRPGHRREAGGAVVIDPQVAAENAAKREQNAVIEGKLRGMNRAERRRIAKSMSKKERVAFVRAHREAQARDGRPSA